MKFASEDLTLDSLAEEDVLRMGLDGMTRNITRALRGEIVDPLERVMNPDFTEPLWEYEHSHIDPYIPGSLHPKQVEALQSRAKHRWLFWGNQTGKTTFSAIEVALLALGRHPYHQYWDPPLVIWASALTWDLWENVLLPELLTWLPKDRVIDAPEPYRKSQKRSIRVLADNGRISRIEGKSAEQGAAKYQSRRLHVVWFDEEHPESVYDEVLPRLLRHGGITINSMTPLKGLTWVHDRIYQPWKQGRPEARDHWCSHAGISDNPGIQPEEVEALKNELRHNPALLAARLYGQFMRPQGLVISNYDPIQHCREIDELSLTTMLARGQLYGGIDFGYWRFAFVLGLVDRAGRMHIIHEIFSSEELLDDRARKIHECLQRHGAPGYISIWGDAANPQDIAEINAAFVRMGSPYRVVPVGAENKLREVGADRIRNLLGRGALYFRKELGAGQVWHLGRGASKSGVPVEGSRLLWELNNWSYPKQKEDKEQKDDPNDASADGADMMAALRYLVMSWWQPPKTDVPPPRSAWEKRVLEAEAERLRRGEPMPGRTKKRRTRYPHAEAVPIDGADAPEPLRKAA